MNYGIFSVMFPYADVLMKVGLGGLSFDIENQWTLENCTADSLAITVVDSSLRQNTQMK